MSLQPQIWVLLFRVFLPPALRPYTPPRAPAERTDIPLVQLLGGWEGYVTPDTGLTHEQFTTDEGLDGIATYASGVGPWKNTIIPINE